jgi:hypothetical protein
LIIATTPHNLVFGREISMVYHDVGGKPTSN